MIEDINKEQSPEPEVDEEKTLQRLAQDLGVELWKAMEIAKHVKQLLQSKVVTRVFGVFDEQEKFIIAYPRKILAEVYMSNTSRAGMYHIKELGIEVKDGMG